MSLKEEDIKVRTLELAVDILKEDPKDNPENSVLRKFAIDIINEFTEKKLSKIDSIKTSESLKVSTDSASEFESWYDRGTGEYTNKRYDKAIISFARALEEKPEPQSAAYTYNYRGTAHVQLGEFKKAIEDYTEAIRLLPKYAIAHKNRGIVNYNINEQEKAFKNFSKASVLYIIKDDYQSALDISTEMLSLSIKTEDKAIPLYLECVAKKKINNENTSECKIVLNEILKKVSTLSWSSDEIETWLNKEQIEKETHTFIEEMTDSLKKHKK
ncbi:MAG: hypothetical protein SCARUB_01206 [Candidatus Scalindua rubra]|uniref:Uncharacterized protein n=1 Tax=Candidatus Scalindua rubra TaxID=1872076 RepID=A0A1E3XDH9_9BACT|nr:MAG: hypothetical protein SCARUB_01206 [Candidatus Scalindua rubra]